MVLNWLVFLVDAAHLHLVITHDFTLFKIAQLKG